MPTYSDQTLKAPQAARYQQITSSPSIPTAQLTQFDPPLDGVFASVQVRKGTNLTLPNHAVFSPLEAAVTLVDLNDLDSVLSSELPAIEYVPDGLVRHKVRRVRTEDLGREDGQLESDEHYDNWDEY